MTKMLDGIQRQLTGEAPPPPIARLIVFTGTVGLVGCDVTDDKGSLVARATSTCLTLRGEQSKGR
jgi:hypothetical protein